MDKPNIEHFWKEYLAVLLAALLFYGASCAPGALWQDSGMFQYRIWHNDIAGGLGLALAHPLYHIIGMVVKQVPIGEYGWRINLISAVCAAFTVANLFLLLRLWLGKVVPALVGAITLGVSWTFWQHGVIAEVYTLYTALFMAELVFLLRYCRSGEKKYLYWLGLFNGLSIANHMWGIVALGCYGVFVVVCVCRKQINLKSAAVIALLWMVGVSSYGYLIIRQLVETGDLAGVLSSALFGNNWGGAVLNASISGRVALENMLFVGLNFPTPNALLFFVGIVGVWRMFSDRRFAVVLSAVMVLFFVFAFRYTVPDRYAFFMPFYCVASAFIGVGAHVFLQRFSKKVFVYLMFVFVFFAMPVYAAAPIIAERMEIKLGTKREIPYRNDYTYFLRPWQCDNDGPSQFGLAALTQVDADDRESVILADGTVVYALWYAQTIEGIGTDVKILSGHSDYDNPVEFPTVETIGQVLAESDVYVVSPVEGYCPGYLLDGYDFVKSGILYRVIERK